MEILKHLMKSDLIMLNNRKNNVRSLALLMAALVLAGTLFVTPIVGVVYGPLLIGIMTVPMLFQLQAKSHCEPMFFVLPVSRRQLVQARFLLMMLLYIPSNLCFYIIALLSDRFKPYMLLYSDEAPDEVDVVHMLVALLENSDLHFTEGGFLTLLFCVCMTFSAVLMSNQLRNFFRDSRMFEMTLERMHSKNKKERRKLIVQIVLLLALVVLIFLFVVGVIDLGPVGVLLSMFIMHLAGAADGMMLSAVILTIGGFECVYQYICTQLEFGAKAVK